MFYDMSQNNVFYDKLYSRIQLVPLIICLAHCNDVY